VSIGYASRGAEALLPWSGDARCDPKRAVAILGLIQVAGGLVVLSGSRWRARATDREDLQNEDTPEFKAENEDSPYPATVYHPFPGPRLCDPEGYPLVLSGSHGREVIDELSD
jgi:hypothetical protein